MPQTDLFKDEPHDGTPAPVTVTEIGASQGQGVLRGTQYIVTREGNEAIVRTHRPMDQPGINSTAAVPCRNVKAGGEHGSPENTQSGNG